MFEYFQKPNTGKRDRIIKYQMVILFTASLLLNVAAMSTKNRILLGTMVAGSALATSLCKNPSFIHVYINRVYKIHRMKV